MHAVGCHEVGTCHTPSGSHRVLAVLADSKSTCMDKKGQSVTFTSVAAATSPTMIIVFILSETTVGCNADDLCHVVETLQEKELGLNIICRPCRASKSAMAMTAMWRTCISQKELQALSRTSFRF